MTRAGVIALARPTFDMGLAAETAQHAIEVVHRVADVSGGPTLISDDVGLVAAIEALQQSQVDALVVLQATFTDSQAIVALTEAIDAPVVSWSFPEARTGGRLRLNSLCGSNLAAHALLRRGRTLRHLHLAPDSDDAEQVLGSLLNDPAPPGTRPCNERCDITAADRQRALDAASSLAGRRIGVIGDHPAGFDPCRYDAEQVQALTGMSVDAIELRVLFEAADSVDDETLVRVRTRVEQDLDGLDRLDAHASTQSMRLYGGLRHLADRREWAAVATRCWPECMTEYGGAACTPQAMLSEDGTPGMCEADVYGCITALVLAELSGSTPFISDLVDVDRDDGTAVIWHCGLAGLSLRNAADGAKAVDHPNRGVPLLNEFALRPGRVTIARVSQAADQLSLVVGTGEMLDRPRPFWGTSGVVRLDNPIDSVLETIMSGGLEHHYGIAYGDHRGALLALAELWEVPVIELGTDDRD